MKVGSLVEMTKEFSDVTKQEYNMVTYPMLKMIYTVREIRDISPHTFICLEEIINPKHIPDNLEYAFNISMFRELQPPMELSELIEECMAEPAFS